MADSRYLVLARKWRPQSFDDVVGQDHITRTLKNAIASGRIHHAFLFIGSRGIGKTTTARILAKALNCLNSDEPTTEPCGECENCRSIGNGSNIDVIEIDGASNNGVDDVREIRDNIRMVPTHGRYKVYIIDEVHQLSVGAFNALLKTLEEPPAHAIFVLATTEAHKIPATIVSRCQRYDFRRVSIEKLVSLLREILDKENITATDEALHAIARAAEGGVRDSESILDELITYCGNEITFKDVFDVLGLVDWKVLHTLSDAIVRKDIAQLLLLVEEVVAGGKDLSQFVQEILRYYRNLLVCKTAESTSLLHLPEDELQEVRTHAARYTLTQLIRLVEQFAELTSGFDSQLAQRIALETLLIRLAKIGVEISVDTVLDKLLQLEANGLPSPSPQEDAKKKTAAITEVPASPTPSESSETTTAPLPAAQPPQADVSEAEKEPTTPQSVSSSNAAMEEPAAKSSTEVSEKSAEPYPKKKCQTDDKSFSEATPPEKTPETVPVTPQKADPATPTQITVSPDSLKRDWQRIVRDAVNTSLNLGVWIAQATPAEIEGDVLVLCLEADSQQARSIIERPDNRSAIETALQHQTTNLRSFKTVSSSTPASRATTAATAPSQTALPFYPEVDAEEAQAVLENPDIKHVLKEFKGRIAKINPPEAS